MNQSDADSPAPPAPEEAPLKIIEPQPPLPDFRVEQLSPALQEVVRKNGWQDLMPVQKKAMPYILNAQDLITQSKTGSGKTGAFLLPLLEVIEKGHTRPQLLVMVPTRELALQVYQEAVKFGDPLGIRSVAVYGGVAYGPQLEAFKRGVHVVVGTPGRLLDLILNGHFRLDSIRDLVLDEADELLSMGFYPDMKRINSMLPRDRCTYLFSATMPVNVKRLAQEFMRAPKFLSLCSTDLSISTMEHIYYQVEPTDKEKVLLKLIEQENPESAIIFCNTRKDTAYIYEYLRIRGLRVGVISGDINQKQRQKVMRDFRSGHLRFLVATDIAARGLDIQGITHVFMFDHPDDPEVYVHRAGRTARAGNTGKAISVVSLLEEMALKRTAEQFGLRFTKAKPKTDQEVEAIIQERASVFLEQEFRQLKAPEKAFARRMVPLLEQLIKSEEEKAVLGMLMHKFYWGKFTGNEGGPLPAEGPGSEAGEHGPAEGEPGAAPAPGG